MALFPPAGRQAWWEVWLRDGRLETFRHVAQRLNIAMKDHTISFPERDVILALATEETIGRLVENTDAVAELRIAKDTPTLFLEMRPVDQADWAGDLLDRVELPWCARARDMPSRQWRDPGPSADRAGTGCCRPTRL